MKFLSIDVGIRNLSFCLFDKTFSDGTSKYEIIAWDNIDVTEGTASWFYWQLINEVAKKSVLIKKEIVIPVRGIYIGD
jgi:hypothetical protein